MAKNQKPKQDTTNVDYEYERNKEELTFQPNIVRKQVSVEAVVSQDKYAQKQMERLAKGREEKERIKMMTERGKMPQ